MAKRRIQVDIEYANGALAGMTITNGFDRTTVDDDDHRRTLSWINSKRLNGTTVKATGTNNEYRFASSPRITKAG